MQQLNARPPLLFGGPGRAFCSCGIAKDAYRRVDLPNMECPNCGLYWCCINDCREEFEYAVNVLLHQFVGHGQSTSILNLCCPNCDAPRPLRTDFVVPYMVCQNCNYKICVVDNCQRAFHPNGYPRHLVTHDDPYRCSCGIRKLRNSINGQCPNCNILHCLFGHCCKEFRRPNLLNNHQHRCPHS